MKNKSAEPHWTDRHITIGFIAWDETGANQIGVYATAEEAKQALIKYAEILNRVFKGEKSENHKSKP